MVTIADNTPVASAISATTDGYQVAVLAEQPLDSTVYGFPMIGKDSVGTAQVMNMTTSGTLQVETTNIGTNEDLANRTLVSNQFVLADHIFRYGIPARGWQQIVSGSPDGYVAHVPAQSSARLFVSSAADGYSVMRTNRYYRYQAGKTVSAELTGYVDTLPGANQEICWGVFDDNDGVFFRLTSTGPEFVVRSSTSGTPTETVIPQASWNTDKFDGSEGNSAPIDFTNGQIFGFRYKWLGYGRIEFSFNETITHVENNANTRAPPFLRSATLPLSVELRNTGAASANNITFVCSRLDMEGGGQPPASIFNTGNSIEKSIGNTSSPLFAVRNKGTFGGVENRLWGLPTLLSAFTDGGSAIVELILNPDTLTGTSWVSVDDDSSLEVDVSATASTGGIILQRFFLAQAQDTLVVKLDPIFDFRKEVLRLSADGITPDVLLVTGRKIKGGTTDMGASITFSEL